MTIVKKASAVADGVVFFNLRTHSINRHSSCCVSTLSLSVSPAHTPASASSTTASASPTPSPRARSPKSRTSLPATRSVAAAPLRARLRCADVDPRVYPRVRPPISLPSLATSSPDSDEWPWVRLCTYQRRRRAHFCPPRMHRHGPHDTTLRTSPAKRPRRLG